MSKDPRASRSTRCRVRRIWAGSWRWRRVLLALITSAALAGISAWLMLAPLEPGSDRQVLLTIPPGATSRDVAVLLEREGLIRDQFFFRLLLRFRGDDVALKAGEYRLGPAMSTYEIVSHLLRGHVVHYPVTIPEGLTVRQAMNLLAERGWGDLDSFLALLDDPRLRPAWLPADAQIREPLEGYLFPDTYLLPRGVTEFQILATMRARMDSLVTAEFVERTRELGMEVHQVMTLASMIEREAQVADERPLIAAVFHNRLKKSIKLDSCATVIYALARTGRDPLTLADLEVDSPYNTYRYAGLPPGPIAAPGQASLQAALYPADVKYLYFVSRGDGSHVFSFTLAEHERNAAKYGAGFR
ncbi:MAG: endolytic transglycosylase MltG [bacterium]|nr:endolytic transglycosylase MltG [bacterium]